MFDVCTPCRTVWLVQQVQQDMSGMHRPCRFLIQCASREHEWQKADYRLLRGGFLGAHTPSLTAHSLQVTVRSWPVWLLTKRPGVGWFLLFETGTCEKRCASPLSVSAYRRPWEDGDSNIFITLRSAAFEHCDSTSSPFFLHLRALGKHLGKEWREVCTESAPLPKKVWKGFLSS